LDQKVALTNQTVPVIQLPGLVYTPYQLDKLTQVKINVFRYKGVNNSPALLHDYTVATNASDYSTLLRVRIKGLVINTLLTVADPFIGGASLDGLHLTALVTSLNSALSTLNKRGYLSNPQVSVTTTAAEALIGHGYISVTFRPADELIQLDANVGLNPGS
jgi:protein involved in polysaccharide export with SLBB domain